MKLAALLLALLGTLMAAQPASASCRMVLYVDQMTGQSRTCMVCTFGISTTVTC